MPGQAGGIHTAHAHEAVYVRSLFKSYTDLFYGLVRPMPIRVPAAATGSCAGRSDRPAYFVCRVTEAAGYDRDTTLRLAKIKEEYRFTYYRRDVQK